jgi:exodeoxyribonuclease VII large subunit
MRALPERFARDARQIQFATDRLRRVGPEIAARAERAMGKATSRLEDLSPLRVIARGYAVCYASDGRSVVKRVTDVREEDVVTVRVGDGSIHASVMSTSLLEER